MLQCLNTDVSDVGGGFPFIAQVPILRFGEVFGVRPECPAPAHFWVYP